MALAGLGRFDVRAALSLALILAAMPATPAESISLQ